MSPERTAPLVLTLSCHPLNFFSIKYFNTRGLRSYFQPVEDHLSFTTFFFTETQVSETTDSSYFFSVSSYFLHPYFPSKTRFCVYGCNDLHCSRAHALESFDFFTICLRLKSHFQTKVVCAVYLSPNSSDYKKIL